MFHTKAFTSFYIILYILLLKGIKTEEKISSILDFDINNNLNDDILTKNKDFDFLNDRNSVISIKNKTKKVACLMVIDKAIKNDNNLKNKLKEAKSENKVNYKKFIKNITDNCIKHIKDEEVNKILDYQFTTLKDNGINAEELLQINVYLKELLEQNEILNKLKELEIKKEIRNNIIKNIIFFILVIAICLIILYIFKYIKKTKKGEKEDKKNKKTKDKKLKKN